MRGGVFGVGIVGERGCGAGGFPVAVAALVGVFGDEAFVVGSVVGVAAVAAVVCGVDASGVVDFDCVVERLVVVDFFGREASEFLVNGGGGALKERTALGARLPFADVLDHLASTVFRVARRHDALALVFR